ncbi:MAG TPA: hypothetical protein VMB25_20415 [Bryobacteraceae bacterium]|nr:hypothetical protein [Bryobacteraceae bacterium]
MKSVAFKTVGMALLVAGIASLCLATPVAPEIDASMAGNALALLAGAVLMIRGRKR